MMAHDLPNSFRASSLIVGLLSVTLTAWVVQRRRHKKSSSTSSRSSPHQQEELFDDPSLSVRLLRKAEAVIQHRTYRLVLVVERCTNDHNHSALLRTAEALGVQEVYLIDALPSATDGGDSAPDENPGESTDSNSLDGPPNSDSDNLETTLKGCGDQAVITSMTGRTVHLTEAERIQRSRHHLFAKKATEWLTLHEFTTTSDCLAVLRAKGYTVWATDLSQEAVPLPSPESTNNSVLWPLPDRIALVVGTEAVGCTDEMLRAADQRVYLPLWGFADSLNLSVAAALILHHIFLLDPTLRGSLSEEDKRELRKRWYPKLARQRLLTSAQKKQRKKLQQKVNACERIRDKMDTGDDITAEQLLKVRKLPNHQFALQKFDDETAGQSDEAVERSLVKYILTPPAPLTDLRRADAHRVSFVGKNTKQTYAPHWSNLPATANVPQAETHGVSTFFRQLVLNERSNAK